MSSTPLVARDGVLEVLEALGFGCFLLDDNRCVLGYNGTAMAVLGDTLLLQGQGITAKDHDSDVRLQGVIQAALANEGLPIATSVGVRGNSGLPFVVIILRLKNKGKKDERVSPRLLLITRDLEHNLAPPHHILTDMFGLTPTEAGIAASIAVGRQLANIAADRGVTIETVRSYSKIVFSKTQTHGQTQLAALLTRLAILIPARVHQLNHLLPKKRTTARRYTTKRREHNQSNM